MKFFLYLKDKRLPFVNEYLKTNNYLTEEFNEDNLIAIQKGDIVVLSPAYKWSEKVVANMPGEITIFAGNISEDFKKIFESKNIKYLNIMLKEDFVLKNATLTAEGMLCDLILNTSLSMFDQKILIIGGGRVAKAVGYLFYKLDLNFDFTMRNEKELNLTKLYAKNCISWSEYKNRLKDYDVVINTVPVVLFDQNDLNKFKTNSTVFELASKQCLEGLNIENFNYVLCPALPSKYTAKAAGNLIVELIKNYLEKGEI